MQAGAEGLGELIQWSPLASLKPMVITATGPLIRVVNDRFPWGVRAAIIRTLAILLEKAKIALKPFVPQLQTTFIRY